MLDGYPGLLIDGYVTCFKRVKAELLIHKMELRKIYVAQWHHGGPIHAVHWAVDCLGALQGQSWESRGYRPVLGSLHQASSDTTFECATHVYDSHPDTTNSLYFGEDSGLVHHVSFSTVL